MSYWNARNLTHNASMQGKQQQLVQMGIRHAFDVTYVRGFARRRMRPRKSNVIALVRA